MNIVRDGIAEFKQDVEVRAEGTIQELFRELAAQVRKMSLREKGRLRRAILSLVPPRLKRGRAL